MKKRSVSDGIAKPAVSFQADHQNIYRISVRSYPARPSSAIAHFCDGLLDGGRFHPGLARLLACLTDQFIELIQGRRRYRFQDDSVFIGYHDELRSCLKSKAFPDFLWNNDLPFRRQLRCCELCHVDATWLILTSKTIAWFHDPSMEPSPIDPRRPAGILLKVCHQNPNGRGPGMRRGKAEDC